MKKAAIIFLVLIYAASSTGFAMKADYCCNHLTSLKLVLADGAKDKEGCCKVKYQSLKVSDAHAAADVMHVPVPPVVFIPTSHFNFEINKAMHETSLDDINIHAPPLLTPPVYLSNCVFRI